MSLVTPGEGREDTRARIDMPADAAMQRVIQAFAATEARLIVTDRAGERGSVEVSHEALIRHWDKLRAWIDDNRDKLRTRARFSRKNGRRMAYYKRNKDSELLGIPQPVSEGRSRRLSPEGADGDVVIDEVKDYIEALVDDDRRRRVAAEKQSSAKGSGGRTTFGG